MDMSKEEAVENFAHRIAAALHGAMAFKGITTDALKQKLRELTPAWDDLAVLDEALTAGDMHKIKSNHLADIGFVLGIEWNIQATKRDDGARGEQDGKAR